MQNSGGGAIIFLQAAHYRRSIEVAGRRWNSISLDEFDLLESSRNRTMAKESKSTQNDVKCAMHKRKEGTLKSGRSGRTVKSKKQAIAIGLSEARAKGKKVPAKKAS